MPAVLKIVALVSLLSASILGDEKTEELSAELKKWQGGWGPLPGGVEHRDGKQVDIPAPYGRAFLVIDDRLFWHDEENRLTRNEDKIVLDIKSDPKRVSFIPVKGDKGRKPIHAIFTFIESDTGLVIQVGLDGGPAPKQHLEFDKPRKGVDGRQWIVGRVEGR